MRVAILGSKGFVGSNIAREAERRGWFVNHIGSRTKNRAALLHDSDAVVHSVGSFMADSRYKRLVSQPISLRSMVELASVKFGLNSPSPLQKSQKSLEDINFGTVKSCVDTLLSKPRREALSNDVVNSRIPFVFISATQWELSDPAYIASKRHAEQYLSSNPNLRSVFLRPGMIAPPKAHDCNDFTPRHLVDLALMATNSPSRVSVDSIAIAACDALADPEFEGVIDCDVLRQLDEQEQSYE